MQLRAFSARAPYRRGGLVFRDRLEPAETPASALTPEGLRELLDDPVITRIEVEKEGQWLDLPRDEAGELLDELVAAMGAEPVEPLTVSIDAFTGLKEQLAEVRRQVDALQLQLDGARQIEASLRGSLETVTGERDRAREEVTDLTRELEVVKVERDGLRKRVEELEAKPAAPSPAKAKGGKGQEASAE